jgi:hypothetical protein
LGALDRANAQPICFFMPCLDLLADFLPHRHLAHGRSRYE